MADPNASDNPAFEDAEGAWAEVDAATTSISEAEAALGGADGDARPDAERALAETRKTYGDRITAAREATNKAFSEARTLAASSGNGDWRDPIEDEELRKYAEKFTSPIEPLKSARELQQKLSKSVVIPGKDATDDEVAAFYKRLGRPDSADKYQIFRPEGMSDGDVDDAWRSREKSVSEMAHASGWTQAQVDDGVKWFYAETAAIEEATQIADTKAREAAKAQLDKEWGDDAETNIEYANRAAKAFGGEEFVEFLQEKEADGVQLGNHPAYLRAFAEIGRRMGEDTLVMGLPDDQKKTMEERIEELSALQNTDPTKYTSMAVQAELADLHMKLYGTGDATGPAKATLV